MSTAGPVLALESPALAQSCGWTWTQIVLPGPPEGPGPRHEAGLSGMAPWAQTAADALGAAGVLVGGREQVATGDFLWAWRSRGVAEPAAWVRREFGVTPRVSDAGVIGVGPSAGPTLPGWYTAGGRTSSGSATAQAQFSPSNVGSFGPRPDISGARYGHSLATLRGQNGLSRGYVLGGSAGCTPLRRDHGLYFVQTELGVTALAPYPQTSGIWMAGVAISADNQFVVGFGDVRTACATPTVSSEVWRYDGQSDTWTLLPGWPMPPRANAAMSSRRVAADEYEVVLFGGDGGDFPSTTNLRGDTWVWNSRTNVFAEVTGPGPGPRAARNQLMFDRTRNWFVLFGGYNGQVLGDTWALIPAVAITQPPADVAVSSGQTAILTGTAEGAGTPTLRWQRNGVDLNDGPTGNGSSVAGSGTGTLTITNARQADAGTYTLRATTTCSAISRPAALTVNCPADYNRDGQLTPADIFAFLNAYFARCAAVGPTPCQFGSADFNNDGSFTPADIFAFLNAYFARC